MAARISLEITAALAHLMSAAGDDGVFSTSEAAAVGIATSTLDRLARTHVVARLTRGWYTVPSATLTPKERHRRTALALIRHHEHRVAASHYTALILHGAPLLGEDLGRVHLTHRRKPSQSSTDGHILHGTDSSVDGLGPDANAVPLPHAVVQAGRTCGPLAALIAADFGLHAGLHTVGDLEAAVAEYRRRPGVGPIRSILAHAQPGAESPAESAARYAMRLAGYAPEAQHEVRVEGRTYRLDLALPDVGIAVEVDGRTKYRIGAHTDLTAPELRERVMREKARAAALNRAGWSIAASPGRSASRPGTRCASTTSTASSAAYATAPRAPSPHPPCVTPGHTVRVDNVDRILRGLRNCPTRTFSPPTQRAS
ncbi:type IV toxin-antitoxin system AbiEi family antitoxin domain-containing protein [Mobilicoccus massiliensis]|uniref:type IV toxin-antitoxin system AbiEi family antitoxin domain-containing protein n=1 Tax=Mobilicoccus massiliensis TaxID=1522310 RepID=UPI00058F300F|nr:type IV toxin-antitoxin system AbiEi family antitoxin domain-containing protein [Mobilicoccus massiliensis]